MILLLSRLVLSVILTLASLAVLAMCLFIGVGAVVVLVGASASTNASACVSASHIISDAVADIAKGLVCVI